jgi:hypothetical protein
VQSDAFSLSRRVIRRIQEVDMMVAESNLMRV